MKDEDHRPTEGELLALPPAWPREWAQRVGREASKLGARTEVRRAGDGIGWEIRWTLGRRPLLTLRPTREVVHVEVALGEGAVRRLLASQTADEEFRQRLSQTSPTRGKRRLSVTLGSARRATTLLEALRLEALQGQGP